MKVDVWQGVAEEYLRFHSGYQQVALALRVPCRSLWFESSIPLLYEPVSQEECQKI